MHRLSSFVRFVAHTTIYHVYFISHSFNQMWSSLTGGWCDEREFPYILVARGGPVCFCDLEELLPKRREQRSEPNLWCPADVHSGAVALIQNGRPMLWTRTMFDWVYICLQALGSFQLQNRGMDGWTQEVNVRQTPLQHMNNIFEQFAV